MKRRLVVTLLPLLVGLGVFLADHPANSEEPAGWGAVKGQVVFDAPAAPAPKALNIDREKEHCLSKGPILSEELVVNPKSLGVRYALVWLAPMQKGAKLPVNPALQAVKHKPVEIDQPCCMFTPRVVALREGQDLVAKNSSPVAHNINWTGIKNPGGNQLIPAKQEYKISGLVAERLPIKIACNIHPWMGGWVGVFDHPYFAVTDENGKFELKDAPAGQYRLMVWQESVGYVPNYKGTEVTIKPNGTIEAEVKMKPPETK
jgi:hypothetical protein